MWPYALQQEELVNVYTLNTSEELKLQQSGGGGGGKTTRRLLFDLIK